MVLILRRVLLLWLFMFWQGGFFFYAAVVVKIGTDLTTMFDQGLITREVTNWLNMAGLVALIPWIWDLLAEGPTCRKRRWACWLILVATLAVLAWLHPQLDALIDTEKHRVVSRPDFRHLHRWYLWISTAQWGVSIFFTFWTLQNWRATDRSLPAPE